MLICVVPALVAISLVAAPSRPEDMGQSASHEVYESPLDGSPLSDAIRRALSDGAPGRNVHLRNYRVLQQQMAPPRFYPMVGPARKVETQVRCTVATDGGTED